MLDTVNLVFLMGRFMNYDYEIAVRFLDAQVCLIKIGSGIKKLHTHTHS
jgi:hypothetical protein